jgi:hypothetical protein
MNTNLLSHQVATLLQDLAFPEYQGDAGLDKLVTRLDAGLAKVGSSVEKAVMSDFRKLYHEDWKDLVLTLIQSQYRDLATERFKQLAF